MCRKMTYLISIVFVLGLAGSVSADLIGHWKFDEGSGTVAYDVSGNGHNGTLNGDPQWTAGHLGGALDFDGTGDYVEITRVVQDDFTLMAWIKADTPGISLGSQGYQGSGLIWSDVADVANDFILAVLGTKLSFFCGNPDLSVNSDRDVVTGEWVHVAATRSAQERKISIYIDGEHEKTIDHTNSGPLNALNTIAIGGNVLDSRYYTGLIDEVRIYDHVLSQIEIQIAMRGAGVKWPYALSPTPADGTLRADTWASLSWRAGDFAVSHDVYFGENFDDVDEGAPGTFRGNQTRTVFTVGIAGSPYPDGLVQGTTYYWRIDEVEADGTTRHKGDVWSFRIARGGGGLKGEYFNNMDLRGTPVLTRIDPQINFYWNPGPNPPPGVNEDSFSVRWTGELEAVFSEPVVFITGSDDGVRLYFDGELIINNWTDHDRMENRSQPIELVAGQTYAIVLEGYENTGEAEWQLYWQSPSMPRQLIPQAALSPPAGAGVIELTDATFDNTIYNSNVPVLVDFWAPWCGPCLTMAPVIEEIADEYAGKVKVCKLNVDNEPQTTSNYGINLIPTFILFKDGQIQRKWIGITSKDVITAAIDRLLYPSQPTGLVIELTDATFENTIYSSDVPVLVDFWAPWCGPCLTMAPVIEEIADEYAGRAKICKLNVDDFPNITTNYGVSAIPTLLLFKDGTSQKRWVGVTSKNDITDAIDELL